ncbi:MAG: DNA repair protein RadC [Bacteroidetes bacterium]|nr:DNA repair protein RadC [Bacteroidota bacterium]
MEENKQQNSIRLWAEDDRPREKLLLKGRHALSDAELIAILLGTGTRGESALDLAKRILRHASDNLLELSHLSINELINSFKGMGPAKAITLMAALELGNRKRISEALRRDKVSTSKDAFEYLKSRIGDPTHEEFWILILNRANGIRAGLLISEGGFSGTVADPKKIFQIALEHKGTAIILGHNHPSGNVKPSEADIYLTRKMKEAGNIMDLPVIDHIIIGEENYFSFADEGLM